MLRAAVIAAVVTALGGCKGGAAVRRDATVSIADGTAGVDAGAPPEAGDARTMATVVVHYDPGAGHRITLRGSGGPLSWTAGIDATPIAPGQWTYSLAPGAVVELKPLIDDATWAVGPNWKLAPGQVLDVWPFFFHTTGVVQKWGAWTSPSLATTRDVWEYLPPSYGENPAETYPVVYMHDGQNLFFDAMSFSGVAWHVQDALDAGAQDGTIHEAIVIGIDNDAARVTEYTPTYDPSVMGGGGADAYLAAVIGELKPQIDASLRTRPDRASTAMIGSSLGGLVSCYAGLTHTDLFGRIGALSPSTWWDGDWIVAAVTASRGKTQPLAVYVDSGNAGPSSDDVTDTAMLAGSYRGLGDDLDYWVQCGGQHSESYWRQRIPVALAFLLGPR